MLVLVMICQCAHSAAHPLEDAPQGVFRRFLAICNCTRTPVVPFQPTREEIIERLSSRWISRAQKKLITEAVSRVKPEHYEYFVTTINTLSSRWMTRTQKALIADAVSMVNPAHYESFVTTINALSSRHMTKAQRVRSTKAISRVQPTNYEIFTNTINELSVGMNTQQKIYTTDIVSWILPDRYPAFTSTINKLSVGMNAEQKFFTIGIIFNTGPSNCIALQALGSQLPSAEMKITAILTLSNYRDGHILRIARALLFARWVETNHEKSQRIIQALETDPDREIPPFGAELIGPNPYTAGQNVHSKDRNKKTRYAYDLLRSLWKPTPDEVHENITALKEYVASHDTSDKIATRVLLGGKNRIKLLPGRFGSLLGNQKNETSLYDGPSQNLIPNETLLAHLWHFINHNLADAEIDHAKTSLMTALRNSREEDGSGICNPGKYQHLATAVLQGRLKGVSIDDTPPIPQDTPLVPVNADLLQTVEDALGREALTERAVRHNSQQIAEFLSPLFERWQEETTRPKTKTEMFRQAFDFWQQFDTSPDPRDMVFFLIFGHGIDDATPRLDPELSWYGTINAEEERSFRLSDYIEQYQAREQIAYREAKAETANLARQASETARINTEAVTKIADERVAA